MQNSICIQLVKGSGKCSKTERNAIKVIIVSVEEGALSFHRTQVIIYIMKAGRNHLNDLIKDTLIK